MLKCLFLVVKFIICIIGNILKYVFSLIILIWLNYLFWSCCKFDSCMLIIVVVNIVNYDYNNFD